ncbi:ABC transporter substrate-binding protein [Streptomyces sp. NBRC 109706]|uniref:ABC transporter substrate-binding protein n=1 Tax=Streptomyces sp. NBRC 109706 TaxID=1550035 RepID=UPI0007838CED|nr:ABC transporter substrate-binding protein [Streptomyces sp. NBRC 109706]
MRRVPLLVLATGLAVGLTACGSSGSSGSAGSGGDTNGDGLREVTVGVIPILDVAPLYLGEAEGVFAEHGLTLDFKSAQGGAAIVPGVVSGEYDFGYSNVTSLMLAQEQGLDLRVVSAGASSTGDPADDFGSIVVPEGSDITSVADLPGRTVAINTLNNINDTLIREAVDQAGGDSSRIEFVELAHSDMVAALETGQVDVAWEVEPFLTIARQGGAVDLWSLYAEATDDLTVATYFASASVVENDPELVEAFAAAAAESFAHATENPDATRAVLSEYTEIDPALYDELTLPAFPTEINRASVEYLAELGDKWGLFDQDGIDLDTLLP